jgi:choline kinase
MGKVKTTINIDEELWKKFTFLVIKEKGYRKKNEIIEQLIKEYTEKREEKGTITIDKVVILAAGMGTRLRPLTNETPKSLLKIGSRMILEHQIENLRECGIREITMVIGHEADKTKKLCKENAWNLNFIYNNLYSTSNNLFSLWLARETFDEGFVCLNSDVVFDVEILKNLLKFEVDICIAVDKKVCIQEDMKVKVKDGAILEINKSMRSEEAYGEFIGIAKFSEKGAAQLIRVLKEMPTDVRRNANLGFGIQKLIDNGNKVWGVNAQRRFCADIDFVEDLMDVRTHFLGKA